MSLYTLLWILAGGPVVISVGLFGVGMYRGYRLERERERARSEVEWRVLHQQINEARAVMEKQFVAMKAEVGRARREVRQEKICPTCGGDRVGNYCACCGFENDVKLKATR